MVRSEIVILIPCYNEEDNIRKTILSIRKNVDFDIIVFDDCSTDSSTKILEEENVEYVVNSSNYGYQKNISQGILYLSKLNYKFIITYDADGEHLPKYLNIFAESLRSGNAVCYGVRKRKNRWSEDILSMTCSILLNLPDPISGFKGYNLTVLSENIDFLNIKEMIGMEILLSAKKNNLPIEYLVMDVSKRVGDSKFSNSFRGNLKILYCLINIFKFFKLKNDF